MKKPARILLGSILSLSAGVITFIFFDQLLVIVTGSIHTPWIMMAAVLGFGALIGTNIAWQRWLGKRKRTQPDRAGLL